jgi:aspartate oxidase
VDEYVRQLEAKAAGVGNPALRRALAEGTAFRLGELRRFGVEADGGHGHVLVHGPFSWPTSAALASMREHAAGLGVEMAFGRAVTGVTISGKRVAGAVVRGEGARETVGAGALVLAGGGFAGLMPHTDNMGRNLGDAMAVGLAAGARAVDAEFMSFQPAGLADARFRQDSVYARPLVLAGKWATPDGRAIEAKQADEHFREQALRVERDDERYDLMCDLSEVPEDLWADELAEAAAEFFGDGPRPARVRVAPLAHYTPGGLEIDERGGTGVDGLYAAGECTGGVFGADRPGGGALSDCIVFGARAGEAAARWAHAQAAGEAKGVRELKPLAREASERLVAEAGWAAWNHGGLYKHEAGLRKGLGWVEDLAAEMAELPAAEDGSCEAAAALVAAALHLAASLRRDETRGNHRRLDCPEARDEKGGGSFRFGIGDLGLGAAVMRGV